MRKGGRSLQICEIKKEVSNIVKAEMEKDASADDWIHGLRHMDRVLDNWKLLVMKCPAIGVRMAKLLLVAAYFHDAKRGDIGEYGDHAKASAAFFLRQKLSWLAKEERDMIEFAIANHNVGLVKLGLKADCERNILLQLLCVIDGLDSLCYVGYFRVLGWYGRKGREFDILSDLPSDTILSLLNGNFADDEIEAMRLKDSGSVLSHLIYDLVIFESVVHPVRWLLSGDFLEEVERRKGKLRKQIEYMIKMNSRNARSLRYFF
jgi:hypothetical protein